MNEGPRGQSGDVYSRYGLQRHGEVQTGQQIHDQVTAVNLATHGPIMGPLMAIVQGSGQVDDLLDGQAVSLRNQGVSTRQAPAAPGVHYLGISHPQLHEMVNNGVDPGTVGAAGDTYTQIGNKLTAFQDRIATAIGSSEADWSGKAADQARTAVAGLGNKASEAGTAAQLAGTLITQQSRALSTAKSTVPPPPAVPYDPAAANARRMAITDPILYVQQATADAAAFQEQKQQHEDAARAVETYDRTVTQTAAAQPAFAPAPPAPPSQPQPEPRPQPPIGTGDSNGRGFTPPPQVGDTTNTAWTAPPVTNTGGNTTNTSGLGGGQNNLGLGGNQLGDGNNNRSGGLNTGFLPGPGAGDKSTGRTGGPAGTGAGRGGTGTGVGGGRVPGGTGVGNPNAAKGFNPGGSAGVLPGDGSAGRGGSTGTSGAATGRGGAGAGAMGAMGAGGAKGKGEEDLERTTPSYLLEPDPDETFGSDALVAPPVIGEWTEP
ncbi:hypothetical protein C8D88_12315 [Lentzea atacamensis]|uniref:PPE family domain-containing protein n=1 Tax=Lentzea atacamensis TaxID=531938 RepID=A0A316HL02_9PSEU|nr:hypothetical protein [Lentzea atacamensis]PWK80651.1 hypothetical protein C8D88_12315 [Lentzea atacamensis]